MRNNETVVFITDSNFRHIHENRPQTPSTFFQADLLFYSLFLRSVLTLTICCKSTLCWSVSEKMLEPVWLCCLLPGGLDRWSVFFDHKYCLGVCVCFSWITLPHGSNLVETGTLVWLFQLMMRLTGNVIIFILKTFLNAGNVLSAWLRACPAPQPLYCDHMSDGSGRLRQPKKIKGRHTEATRMRQGPRSDAELHHHCGSVIYYQSVRLCGTKTRQAFISVWSCSHSVCTSRGLTPPVLSGHYFSGDIVETHGEFIEKKSVCTFTLTFTETWGLTEKSFQSMVILLWGHDDDVMSLQSLKQENVCVNLLFSLCELKLHVFMKKWHVSVHKPEICWQRHWAVSGGLFTVAPCAAGPEP